MSTKLVVSDVDMSTFEVESRTIDDAAKRGPLVWPQPVVPWSFKVVLVVLGLVGRCITDLSASLMLKCLFLQPVDGRTWWRIYQSDGSLRVQKDQPVVSQTGSKLDWRTPFRETGVSLVPAMRGASSSFSERKPSLPSPPVPLLDRPKTDTLCKPLEKWLQWPFLIFWPSLSYSLN